MRIGPAKIVSAISNHLLTHPIGTVGLVWLAIFPSLRTLWICLLGFLVGIVASLISAQLHCLTTRFAARSIAVSYSRTCELSRRDVWEYISKDDIQDILNAFESRAGKFARSIYERTISQARVFEYDADFAKLRSLREQGLLDFLYIPVGMRAFVDVHGYSYVFIPKTDSQRQKLSTKFLLLHEISHVLTHAALPRLRYIFEPVSIAIGVFFLLLFLEFSPIALILVLQQFLLLAEYFSPKEIYLEKLGTLSSECHADWTAAQLVTPSERPIISKLVLQGKNFFDEGLTSEMNLFRKHRLERALQGEDVVPQEIDLYKSFDAIWKVLGLIALATLCREPLGTTVAALIVFGIVAIIFFFLLTSLVSVVDRSILQVSSNST